MPRSWRSRTGSRSTPPSPTTTATARRSTARSPWPTAIRNGSRRSATSSPASGSRARARGGGTSRAGSGSRSRAPEQRGPRTRRADPHGNERGFLVMSFSPGFGLALSAADFADDADRTEPDDWRLHPRDPRGSVAGLQRGGSPASATMPGPARSLMPRGPDRPDAFRTRHRRPQPRRPRGGAPPRRQGRIRGRRTSGRARGGAPDRALAQLRRGDDPGGAAGLAGPGDATLPALRRVQWLRAAAPGRVKTDPGQAARAAGELR